MSDKIFDLEQRIIKCWSVVDDLDDLYHYFGDDPFFKGMDGKHKDKIRNLLLGMKEMYQIKFQKCFFDFEDVCKEYHSNRKDLETIAQKHREDIQENYVKEIMTLKEALRLATNERESFDSKEHPDDSLVREWQQMQDFFDFAGHELQEREDKAARRSIDDATPEEWDRVRSVHDWDEERIDNIGRNGNDGLHYNKVNKND